MLTLTRSGLTLNLNASVVPATGSSNVPILYMEEISDDYTGYLVEPRIGFTQNGKYTEFIGTYEEETQSVIIPAQCFANTGSVDITIALIDPEDPDHVEVCTPKKFSVTKAPMGTVVLPEEPTWQDYVLNYMKQNLDKLQGPQGDKGEPGDNATINVGAVTTLEPGQEATVTNTGSETNAVLAFGIPKGEKGDKGDKGDKGEKGDTGGTGPQGIQGPQGEKGDKGDKGDTGEQGPQGIQGPKGDTGETGPQGPQGEVGPQGPQGEKGDTGDQGPKGDKGETGDNATIAIGTVTTLEPDQEATVQNTGTETNAVLSFGIPKGKTGDTGPQGPQGAPGINENVLHADISKSENPSVDDAYEAPLQDLKMYGKSTQMSTRGKNLFDKSLISDITVAIKYVPLNLGEGTFTCSSDITDVSGLANIFFLAGNVTEGVNSGLNGVDENSSITQTAVDGYVTIACRSSSSSSSSGLQNNNNPNDFNIQIEKGSTATAYEPYTGGAPSPSPDYPQEITKIEEVDCLVTGRNIFDYQSIVDEATDAGFSTSAVLEEKEGRNCLKIDVREANFRKIRFLKGRFKENTQYKFSITGYYEGTGSGLFFQIRYTDESLEHKAFEQSNSFSNIEILSASDKTVDCIWFSFGNIPIGWFDLDSSYIVELSQDTGEYEPYKSQHVQFTPPAPLYSLLNGRIADYVDVARGKYVYQFKKTLVTSSNIDSLEYYYTSIVNGHGFRFRIGDKITDVPNYGICRELKANAIGDYPTLRFSATTYLYVPYIFESEKTIDEIKQWLDEISGLNIVYQLATATEQDIPIETLEALQALKTFNGVTNIFCNAPVSAQYEQSVQIVMNKILEQLNKLQTQTLNLQEEMINNV